MNNTDMTSIIHSRAGKFYRDCRNGKYPIPALKRGNQNRRFEDGTLVEYYPDDRYQGVVFKVLDAKNMNGYWKYTLEVLNPKDKVASHFARQDDLFFSSQK